MIPRQRCPECRYLISLTPRRLGARRFTEHQRWVGGSTRPVIDIGWPQKCPGSGVVARVSRSAARLTADPQSPTGEEDAG